MAFAVENMYPWRAPRREMEVYLPAGTPPRRTTPTPRSTSRTRRRALRPGRDGRADGRRGCGTSTSPTGPARPRTSTSCPAAADAGRRASSSTWPATGFDGHIVLEINTRKAPTARSASATWSSRWSSRAPALRRRVHRRAEPRRRARAPRASAPGRPTPGRRSWRRPGRRSPSTVSRVRRSARRRRGRRRRGPGAPLLRHQGRALPRRPRAARRPAQADRRRPSPSPVEQAAERFLGIFLSVWDDPDIRPSLVAVARGIMDPAANRLLSEGVLRSSSNPSAPPSASTTRDAHAAGRPRR